MAEEREDTDKEVADAIYNAAKNGELIELKRLLEVPRSTAVLDTQKEVSEKGTSSV